eukprot:TRINITY_DN17673_c0_g1_i2.p1 TRINITY_DN17673_c0_g1~~TRINITY_DN17673_c0_g1_i2.p1  ORF type:complete len:539 (+),score=145.31 TRINITY_DN17673_c0_g1_i2:135-1751(+)
MTTARTLKIKTKALLLPESAYDFKSDSILDTLEELRDDIKKQKNEADIAEIKAHGTHSKALLALEQNSAQKKQDLKTASSDLDMKQTAIGSDKQELEETDELLRDDETYLAEIKLLCKEKADTFADRSETREKELSAIRSAASIISDSISSEKPDGEEAASSQLIQIDAEIVHVPVEPGASAPSLPLGGAGSAFQLPVAPDAKSSFIHQKPSALSRFLAKARGPKRQELTELLRTRAENIQSPALLTLADAAATDPLDSVRQMISELISKMQKQAADAQDHKGYCDKAIGEAELKRDQAAAKVKELNLAMVEKEAHRDKLSQDLSLIDKELADLNASRVSMEKLRREEEAEANASMTEAKEAAAAVVEAKSVLKDFYTNASSRNAESSAGLLQTEPAPPDAGFKNGEAYKGATASATGILGMLEVVQSGFEDAVDKTMASEEKAEREHVKFLQETEVSEAEKKEAKTVKEKFKVGTLDDLTKDDEALKSNMGFLHSAVTQLSKLDEVCGIGSTHADRQMKRRELMSSLKDAIALFDSA